MTEKEKTELLNKFAENEITLYDFAKTYPDKYRKNKEFVDSAWETYGKPARERIGILIGGGNQKARELWTYYILAALEIKMPLSINPKTQIIFDEYEIEDAVVWRETRPGAFYSSAGEMPGFGTLFDPYYCESGNFIRCNIITTSYSCDQFLFELGKLDEPSHAERRIQFRINLDSVAAPLTTCRNFQSEAWHISGTVYDILSRFSYVWSVFMANEKAQKEFDISVDNILGKFKPADK